MSLSQKKRTQCLVSEELRATLQILKSLCWSLSRLPTYGGWATNNLHLMIPFIRRPWELIQIKSMIAKAGLFNLPGFKLLIMVEVPAAALELENFLKIGVDGVSIGTNDLTMMLLGVDREQRKCSAYL